MTQYEQVIDVMKKNGGYAATVLSFPTMDTPHQENCQDIIF